AGTSERISARSRFLPLFEPLPAPNRLMSQNTPDARKPCGTVIEPGMDLKTLVISRYLKKHQSPKAKLPRSSKLQISNIIRSSYQPRRLRKTAQDIHTLHRLSARALNDIVLCTHDDEAASARVEPPRDLD